jgi:hypothetical protein
MKTFNTCNTVNQCTKLSKDLISQLDLTARSADARAALILNASYARQEQIRERKQQEKNVRLASYEALVF